MYHAKVNEGKFVRFTDALDVKGETILEYPIDFPFPKMHQGKIIARWRDFSDTQAAGHDLYPCIDLQPDEETLEMFGLFLMEEANNGVYLMEGIDGCRLSDCTFRITDYGYLNIRLVFEVDNVDALEKISHRQTTITRAITQWAVQLQPVLRELQKQGCVKIGEDWFGIPLKIKDVLSIDESDMYTYQDLTVLSGESQELVGEIRQLYGINDEYEKVESYKVHGIDQSAIICTGHATGLPEIEDIIEPYNLLLAEINTYDSIGNLNYAIIKLMNDSDLSKTNKKRFRRKDKVESAFNNFTSSDLRKMTINTHYILHCINFRKTAIEHWQNLFMRKFKDKNPYEENRQNCERSEAIIQKLIEEKTQESQKGHSNTLEILFMFLSAITIYSTYVDVISFLDSAPHSNISNLNPSSLEIKIFLSISLVLVVIFLWIVRVKKNR